MQFIDEAKIHVKAGDGGNGCVAFRRESHVPRGGPSGGDGGNGGNVIFRADTQLNTLMDFRYKRHYKAPRGEDGRSKDQYGKGGEDLVLRVPVGTLIFNEETADLLGDLDNDGDELVVAKGGNGGRGNIHFATPWNQAPRTSEPGTPGEEYSLRLELKLLAQVGLLGYPNVGKSTFIAQVSRAKPKIADYPFTTLIPNLGVVRLSDERTMVVADIPGLIEGAADGQGLGHRFLKHVERTKVLLHIVEMSELTGPERDPLTDFDTLNNELRRYAPDLEKKPQVVALNKMDLTDTRDLSDEIVSQFEQRGVSLHLISAASGEGIKAVLEELWKYVSNH